MKSMYSLLLPLLSLISAAPAWAAEFSLGGKLGHQSIRLESSSVKAIEILSSNENGQNQQTLAARDQEPFRTGEKNGPVVGAKLSLIDAYWAASAELDYAQFSARPGSTLGIYSLGVSGEVNFVKQAWIRVYGLAGLSARWMETNRELSDDFVDRQEVLKTEPITTLNRDLGLGIEIPLSKDLSIGFSYRRSESLAADGRYSQAVRTTDSLRETITTSETRAEYKDFRYNLKEYVISLSLRSLAQ